MDEPIKWRELSPRQRDFAVHEKVMGKALLCNEPIILWRAHGFYVLSCAKCGALGTSDEKPTTNEHRNNEEPLPYTTDIRAAWLVVEHITQPPKNLEEAYRAANTTFGFWFDNASLWAETETSAAEKICIAALRSVGVEIED